MKKDDFRALIAADALPEALELLAAAAVSLEKSALQNAVSMQRSRLENLEKERQTGATDRDDLLVTYNGIKSALLHLLDELPDGDLPIEPKKGQKPPARARGMTEQTFRNALFFGMLAVKIWLVAWILLHRSTGGFASGEAVATIALLAPAFTAYTGAMAGFLIRRKQLPFKMPDSAAPRASAAAVWVAAVVVPIYGFSLHALIGAKAQGELKFEEMSAAFAVVESLFGVYIGQLVAAFFRKGE